jgi:hypothetical protein
MRLSVGERYVKARRVEGSRPAGRELLKTLSLGEGLFRVQEGGT